MTTDPRAPLPAHLQKEFEDLVQQRFRGQNQAFSRALSAEGGELAADSAPWDWHFSLTPRQVKAHLDRAVIGQDQAKKALAIAVCDHYNQARHLWRLADREASQPYSKQNILLLGPTGVGKTYLVQELAQLIGVPFVKADATKFSETGYVGAKVEDMLRELVQQAKGDLRRAAAGIIYLDEGDKLARRSRGSGKDVNTQGVQFGLLRLMEETEVDLRQAADQQLTPIGDSSGGRVGSGTLNTKYILFIVSGAFHGLDEIIQRRLRIGSIGFADRDAVCSEEGRRTLLDSCTVSDLIQYGLEPEFIGRLPVRVACHPLSAEDYFAILTTSEGSILKQYQSAFRAYGIELTFTEGALRRVAEEAAREGTGARALLSICERALRPFKFELPSTAIRSLELNEELLEDPENYLGDMLQRNGLDGLRN